MAIQRRPDLQTLRSHGLWHLRTLDLIYIVTFAGCVGASAMFAWLAYETWREVHEPPPAGIDPKGWAMARTRAGLIES